METIAALRRESKNARQKQLFWLLTAMVAAECVEPNDRTQRFNWIGRAGCVFFFKGFVVRWVRA